MMTHLNETILNKYLDQVLDEATRVRVAGHLAECDDCRKRLAEMESLFADLAELPEVPLRVDLSRRVVERISAEFQPRPIPRWTIPIVFLQLLAALGLFIWLRPSMQSGLETVGRMMPETAEQILPQFSLAEAVEPLLSGLEQLGELGKAIGPNAPLPLLEGILIIGLASILWLAGSGLLLRQSLLVQRKT